MHRFLVFAMAVLTKLQGVGFQLVGFLQELRALSSKSASKQSLFVFL